MLAYLTRRLLLSVPTVLVISGIGFALVKCSPVDPVTEKLRLDGQIPSAGNASFARDYRATAASLGLDKPLFYLSVQPAAYPDTFFALVVPREKAFAESLLAHSGHWARVQDYLHALEDLQRLLLSRGGAEERPEEAALRSLTGDLRRRYDPVAYPPLLARLEQTGERLEGGEPRLSSAIDRCLEAYRSMEANPRHHRWYIPRVVWHGLGNQYHTWLFGFLSGDFGVSYRDGRPVADRVWSAWSWTLLLNGCALVLAYLISIPTGVWSAAHRGSRAERWVSGGLFALYAMPTFWIGSLCLILFTTSEYGMDWFPTLWQNRLPESMSVWGRFWSRLSFFVLPVVCLTYPALALISRQVRGGTYFALRQDYTRTAQAKGLPDSRVLWKHAFRNALFPLITLFASILPELLAGSVVIEVIFNIPGMGRLMVDSLLGGDWPVVYAVLLLGALLTILGLLLADILYYLADPRVNLGTGAAGRNKSNGHAP